MGKLIFLLIFWLEFVNLFKWIAKFFGHSSKNSYLKNINFIKSLINSF